MTENRRKKKSRDDFRLHLNRHSEGKYDCDETIVGPVKVFKREVARASRRAKVLIEGLSAVIQRLSAPYRPT